MATRIISGVLVLDDEHHRSGKATVTFVPHAVVGDVVSDRTDPECESVGPVRRFVSTPCKVVSLRRVEAADQTRGALDRVAGISTTISTATSSR